MLTIYCLRPYHFKFFKGCLTSKSFTSSILQYFVPNLLKTCSVWTSASSRFNNQYFLKMGDKRTILAIINYYKTMWGNLAIHLPAWATFTNVFSYEKTVYNSVRNEISQIRNIIRETTNTIVRIGVLTSFLSSPPPLNQQTVQAAPPPPFRQYPPLYWFFMKRVGFFSEPPKY